MARSRMGNFEELQHQCQHHTSHWKSVWQGPEFSPVQCQHRKMVQNYSRSSTRVSTLINLCNIFLERIMCDALDDYEGSVSIGGRPITTFHDIVVNAEEEKEAGFLIDRLDRTTTRYKMEISPDKTKVMTNNPNCFQREIKIKGKRLEEVENFKYLGAIISNEGSKSVILSRIAQTTAALSRLKIIWTSRLLLRLSWCGRSSYLPTFMLVRAGPWQQKSREGFKPLRWDTIWDFWTFPTKTMWRTRRFATESRMQLQCMMIS